MMEVMEILICSGPPAHISKVLPVVAPHSPHTDRVDWLVVNAMMVLMMVMVIKMMTVIMIMVITIVIMMVGGKNKNEEESPGS